MAMNKISCWKCGTTLVLAAAVGCTDRIEAWDESATANEQLGAATTIVSLTFDDTRADQFSVRPILAAHGMKATFYLNSQRLGMDENWLSVAQVRALVADGHEVGGHTLNHANLAHWPDDVVRKEVCNDRAALLDLGFAPSSFAFPFGSPQRSSPEAASVEAVVRECGYNSARGTGDLLAGASCPTCPIAEAVPPANPYHVRGRQSVNSLTTLGALIDHVVQAENQGGGWVPVVFHHVCDGCNYYSIAPEVFSDFLSWLEPRAALGTVVRSVGEVVGGDLRPAVLAPPSAAPEPGANLIVNPSLELDLDDDGVPDCWQPGGTGTSTARYEMLPDAAEGRFAELITVSSLSSGARRLVTRQDRGLCAPSAFPNHSYQVSAFYRATVPVRFIAYYANEAGKWFLFAQSGWLDTQLEYAQAQWSVPPLPADATRLSVGMSIFAAGQLTLDAFSLRDIDRTPPSIQLVAPGPDSRRSNTVLVAAQASDAGGMHSVQFFADGQRLEGEVTRHGDSYSMNWNTTPFPDGEITLTAMAVDRAGNVASAETRIVVDSSATNEGVPVPWMTCNGVACTSNWSAQPITLELGCLADGSSSVCSSRYSLVGLDPIERGELYVGPVTVSNSAEVRAAAVSCQGTTSAVLAHALLIDTTPPTRVEPLSPLSGVVATGTVPIVVDPTDNIARVRFFLDGTQLGTRTASPWRWNWNVSGVPSGNHQLHVVIEDRAGNTSTSGMVAVSVP